MLQKELECYQIWYCYHFCVDKKVQQIYIFTISISFVLQSKNIYIYLILSDSSSVFIKSELALRQN